MCLTRTIDRSARAVTKRSSEGVALTCDARKTRAYMGQSSISGGSRANSYGNYRQNAIPTILDGALLILYRALMFIQRTNYWSECGFAALQCGEASASPAMPLFDFRGYASGLGRRRSLHN